MTYDFLIVYVLSMLYINICFYTAFFFQTLKFALREHKIYSRNFFKVCVLLCGKVISFWVNAQGQWTWPKCILYKISPKVGWLLFYFIRHSHGKIRVCIYIYKNRVKNEQDFVENFCSFSCEIQNNMNILNFYPLFIFIKKQEFPLGCFLRISTMFLYIPKA